MSDFAYNVVYTGRTSSYNDDVLAVEDFRYSIIVAVYLLAREVVLARYTRDPGLEIVAVAHHDCVERLDHDYVSLQVPDLDRPLPVPRNRLHQLYIMQQLQCYTTINKLTPISSN